jgi:calcineurin-like phosphoesterase family protein
MFHKIILAPEEEVFFTSDTHFGHDKPWIVQARGFTDVRSHDEALIERWNARVKPGDRVYHLGDAFVGHGGGDQHEYAKEVLSRLNGRIYYVNGNHNAGMWQLYEEADKCNDYWHRSWKLKVVFVGPTLWIRLKGRRCILTHYPQQEWADIKRGVWNLCGHSHGRDPGSQPENPGRRLDVGVDNFPNLVTFSEISEIMKNRPHASPD